MAWFKDQKEVDAVIGGFLRTFPRLDPVLREVTHNAAIALKLELTAPELNAEIDLARRPLQVHIPSDAGGAVAMSGTADNFHLLLLGRLGPGVAINQKKLLVRGSSAKMAKVVPLIYLAPYIYPFYLQSIGRGDLIVPGELALLHAERPKEGVMNKLVSVFSYLAGYSLGLIKTYLAPGLDVLSALEALGQGLRKATAKDHLSS